MIITISREFGSGGRELGKRLADILHFDYYDREIISRISDETGLQENYIEKSLDEGHWRKAPIAFHRSFSPAVMQQSASTELLVVQTKILREIAKSSENVVIVGRCADVVLAQYHPFKLFVYADMESKMIRCFERADEKEHLTKAEMVKKMKRIDNQRTKTRELMNGGKMGMKENCHLMINTSGMEIKALAPVIADYARLYQMGGKNDKHI